MIKKEGQTAKKKTQLAGIHIGEPAVRSKCPEEPNGEEGKEDFKTKSYRYLFVRYCLAWEGTLRKVVKSRKSAGEGSNGGNQTSTNAAARPKRRIRGGRWVGGDNPNAI